MKTPPDGKYKYVPVKTSITTQYDSTCYMVQLLLRKIEEVESFFLNMFEKNGITRKPNIKESDIEKHKHTCNEFLKRVRRLCYLNKRLVTGVKVTEIEKELLIKLWVWNKLIDNWERSTSVAGKYETVLSILDFVLWQNKGYQFNSLVSMHAHYHLKSQLMRERVSAYYDQFEGRKVDPIGLQKLKKSNKKIVRTLTYMLKDKFKLRFRDVLGRYEKVARSLTISELVYY